MTDKVKLDSGALRLIGMLEECGFSAYAVGGCVRDSLLDRPVSDIDIAVSSVPQQTKRVLSENGVGFVETGILHGTVTAVLGGKGYELTSFRSESGYSDNRHPDSVSFVTDIRSDLSRRDFTVNAMAYNPREGIIDLFGGRADLENMVIRTVGSPEARFEEDSLRILRALRFASVLDFEIEDKTAAAMHKKSSLLKNIARERVTNELIRLLAGSGAMRVLDEYRDIVFCMNSEFPRLVAGGTWECAVRTVDMLPENSDIRLAALILFLSQSVDVKRCTVSAPDVSPVGIACRILRAFRLKSLTERYICRILENISNAEPIDMAGVKRAMSKFGVLFYTDLLTLKAAVFRSLGCADRCCVVERTLDRVREVADSGEAYCLSQLAVNGNDLKTVGYCGIKIGQLLNELFELVITGRLKNDRDEMIKYLAENAR